MIEEEIEKAIVDRIQDMNIDGLYVMGLWQQDINNKGVEPKNAKGVLAVRVSPCYFETYGLSECIVDVVLGLSIRSDLSPNGEALVQICDPIQKMLIGWNTLTSGEQLEDFDLHDFSAGGLQVNGGTGPEVDQANKTWTISWTFTIKGIIK